MKELWNMSEMFRTHYCGEITAEFIDQEVVLSGWVNKRRDLGGLIFIDLRDRSGLVQIVFSPEVSEEALGIADRCRTEYVISVRGRVVRRAEGNINPNLPTGEVEVLATEIEIINIAKTPPFSVSELQEVDEKIRLKYRYIDLRRPSMQKTFMIRHQITKMFRDYLSDHGFIEVETPILTKSTPEGARDYLVPSRVHPGEFYALPQSPQLFKQLLMVSGFDRYFQVARCFRDEDLRADRQPEFTQVDIEMSFLPLETFHSMMEELMVKIIAEITGVKVERPFLRMTYQEAMDRYGSDKPDLRFGLELVELSDLVAESQFSVFSNTVQNGGQVKGINAKGAADRYSRKDIAALEEFVKTYGAKGLAWLKVEADGIKGPIAKFFNEEELKSISKRLGGELGDLFLFVADKAKVVADSLGALRSRLGKELGLIEEGVYKLLWVTDFPLVEFDEEEQRYVALHHPFTRPRDEDIPLFDSEPSKIRAMAYDLVMNGYEIAGGSMRIYRRDIQEKMFACLGFSKEEAEEKFGFLLEAFDYGTPPHGGIAFGLDRIVAILAGKTNLREVIAFPKTASATDLMTDAPGPVESKQLDELGIQLKVKENV
jgi:aspartyl-tRNA synthetase